MGPEDINWGAVVADGGAPIAPNPQAVQAQKLDALRQQAQQAQQPAAPIAPPVGPGEALGAAGGAVLGLLGKLFSAPREAVQTALAGSPEQFHQFARDTAYQGNDDPLAAFIAEHTGNTPQDVQQNSREFVGDLITDPWTYLPFGLLGKAAGLARAQNAAPLFVHALDILARGEEAANALPATILKAPFVGVNTPQALKDLIPWVPSKLLPGAVDATKIPGSQLLALNRPVLEKGAMDVNGVAVPTTSERAATSLYDFLSNQSRESILKLTGRQLYDGMLHVLGRGGDLGQDLADLSQAKAGQLLPAFTNSRTAYQTLSTADTDLVNMVDNLANPYAKAAGLELIAETEQRNQQAWQAVLDKYEPQIRQDGEAVVTGRAAGRLWRQMYQEGYEAAIKNTVAARDALLRIARQAGDVNPDNEVAQAVNNRVSLALQGTEAARMMSGLGNGAGLFRSEGVSPGFFDQGLGRFITRDLPLREKAQRLADQAANIQTAVGGVRSDLLDQFGEGLAPFLPERNQVIPYLEQRLGELNLLQKGLPGSLYGLPPELQGVMLKFVPELQQQLGNITKSRQQLETGLNALWERYMPEGTAYTPFNPGFGEGQVRESEANWLQHINQQLSELGKVQPDIAAQLTPSAPGGLLGRVADFTEGRAALPQLTEGGPVSSARDLYERFLRDRIPDATNNTIRKAMDAFPAGDLFQTDPYFLAYDRVLRQHAKELGLSDDKVRNFLGLAQSILKETMLLAPSYPINNVYSGLIMSALEGVNPLRIMRSLVGGAPDIWYGTYQGPSHVRDLETVMGRRLDTGATAASAGIPQEVNPGRAASQQGISASAVIGPARLATIGGIGGAISGATSSPSDATPLERLENAALGGAAGAGVGAALPTASKFWLGRLGYGLEDVLRKEAAFTGTSRAITQVADVPGQIAERVLGKNSPVVDYINARQGLISPDRLEMLLLDSGAAPDAAHQAAREWQVSVDHAFGQGTQLSQRINFDYANLNNLEQFSRAALPFSTWALKALPFFGEHLTQNPLILRSILALEDESQRQKEEAGLTSRFTGSLRVPFVSDTADQIYGSLLGRPIKTYFNPLNGIFPFADFAKATADQPDDNAATIALRYLRGAGLPGPGPLADLGVRALFNDPASGLFRFAAPIQGMSALLGVNRGRGIDLNAAQINAENATRGLLNKAGGREAPPDLQTAAILRRLYELSIEDNGGLPPAEGSALAAPYVTAAVQQQGPLWDRAAADVAKERGVRGLGSFAASSFTPSALLNPTEESIRGARNPKVLDDRATQVLARAAVATPDAPVADQLVEQVRDAVLDMTPWGLPAEIEKRLANPTARNVNQVRVWATEARQQLDPLARGYPESGSPERQRLQALLALTNNLPAQFMLDPAMAQVTSENLVRLGDYSNQYRALPPLMQAMLAQHRDTSTDIQKYGKTRRDLLAGQDELLRAYQAYQQAHAVNNRGLAAAQYRPTGTGSIDDFLENVWLPAQSIGLRR